MLWLVLLSPLAALTLLIGMQRFETWMLASVPRRPGLRPDLSARRAALLGPRSSAPRVLVPRPRAPQRS
jgi:hypothetical protein